MELSGNYKQTYYILDNSKPFTGSVQNTMRGNGFVDYMTEPTTFEDYSKGKDYKVVDETTLDNIMTIWLKSMESKLIEITEDRYFEMLEALPPVNWRDLNEQYNVFMFMENSFANMTSCFVKDRISKKYYECTLDINSTDEKVLSKIKKEL